MLRFTIRDLGWLTLIVAVGLAWWLHARRLQGEVDRLRSDLKTQARFVDQFTHVLMKLGCELPEDSDPRCAFGGPYTRVFVPINIQNLTGCVSFTLSGPRTELQRSLDGEFY